MTPGEKARASIKDLAREAYDVLNGHGIGPGGLSVEGIEKRIAQVAFDHILNVAAAAKVWRELGTHPSGEHMIALIDAVDELIEWERSL